MKFRKIVPITVGSLVFLLTGAVIASTLYLGSLFSLIDRTEITGNPNIAESDLLAGETRLPDGIDPGKLAGLTEIGGESQPLAGNGTATGTASETQPAATAEMTTATTDDAATGTATGTAVEATTGTAAGTAAGTTAGTETGTAESSGDAAAPTTVPAVTTSPTLPDGLQSNPDVINILLVGVDTRGTGFTGRSDAMIILSVNKRTQKIHLASLARNMIVAIRDHGNTLLDFAYSWGGMPLLLETIQANFRLKLDNYLVINFGGFTKAIDYCGGVDISLTTAEVNYMYLAFPDGSFKVGANRLNGAEALVYARIRWIDSDYSRTARQRKVISSLINRLKTRSPAQIDALMRKVLPLMRTNLSNAALIELAISALQFRSWPISQLMLPVSTANTTITGANAEKNIAALMNFLFVD